MSFPLSILYLICEAGEMKQAVTFMQTCKSVRDYFMKQTGIQVRRELFRKYKAMERLDGRDFYRSTRDNTDLEAALDSLQLESWILEPLPVNGALATKILTDETRLLCRQLVTMLHRPFLVTGGYISQRAFGQYWESDIDVFMTGQDESRTKTTLVGMGEVDLIVKRVDRVEQVMSHFDISMCQVGIKYDGRSLMVYATPFFLCSKTFGMAAIQVSDLSCQYLDRAKQVESMFTKHVLFHEGDDFLTCEACTWPISMNMIDGHYVRWLSRVQKYRKRFPSFNFYYFCARNPTTSNAKRLKVK